MDTSLLGVFGVFGVVVSFLQENKALVRANAKIVVSLIND
jgi:hypothetical protein